MIAAYKIIRNRRILLATRKLDWTGLALSVSPLPCCVYGIIEGTIKVLDNPAILGAIARGLVLIG